MDRIGVLLGGPEHKVDWRHSLTVYLRSAYAGDPWQVRRHGGLWVSRKERVSPSVYLERYGGLSVPRVLGADVFGATQGRLWVAPPRPGRFCLAHSPPKPPYRKRGVHRPTHPGVRASAQQYPGRRLFFPSSHCLPNLGLWAKEGRKKAARLEFVDISASGGRDCFEASEMSTHSLPGWGWAVKTHAALVHKANNPKATDKQCADAVDIARTTLTQQPEWPEWVAKIEAAAASGKLPDVKAALDKRTGDIIPTSEDDVS